MKYVLVLFLIFFVNFPSLQAKKDFNELALKSTEELVQNSLTELNAKRNTPFHAITKINKETIVIEPRLKYAMNVSVVKIQSGLESVCFIEFLHRNTFHETTEITALLNFPLEKKDIKFIYGLPSTSANINNNQSAELTVADLLTKVTDYKSDPEYRLLKLNSFTSEKIYKSRYEIDAVIYNVYNDMTSTCKIDIVDESWEAERIRATIDCPGEEIVHWRYGP